MNIIRPIDIEKCTLMDNTSLLLLPNNLFAARIKNAKNGLQPIIEAIPATEEIIMPYAIELPILAAMRKKIDIMDKKTLTNWIISAQHFQNGIIIGINGLSLISYNDLIWIRNNISNVPTLAFSAPNGIYSSIAVLKHKINVIASIQTYKYITPEIKGIDISGHYVCSIGKQIASRYIQMRFELDNNLSGYIASFSKADITISKAIIGIENGNIRFLSRLDGLEDKMRIGYYRPDYVIEQIQSLQGVISDKQTNPFFITIPMPFWIHCMKDEQKRILRLLNNLNYKGIIPIVVMETGLLHSGILDGGNIYIVKIG